MLNRVLTVVCAIVFAARCASSGPAPEDLASRVEGLIRANGSPAFIGIAYQDMQTGRSYFRNERTSFHAASTMKVPVMVALMEAVEAEVLSLEQPVMVSNEFTSLYDKSSYALIASEDSDAELYSLLGRPVALQELLRRMITRSSNLGTNLLLEFIGAPKVMEVMRGLGANDIRILRGVQDIKAFDAGMNNTVTAYDLMLVLRRIAERRAVSSKASALMIDILRDQEFNEGIPAGLPADVLVAHKTGSITKHYHDAAIVYPRERPPYLLVILTRDARSEEEAVALVRSLSTMFWHETIVGGTN